MAGMKCKHCSKICGITCGIIKHLSMYKMQQSKARYIVPRDSLYKTNSFLIAKAKTILPLVELISRKKSLYTDAFDRKDPVFDKIDPASINKAAQMSNKTENIKMPVVRHIFLGSEHINSS